MDEVVYHLLNLCDDLGSGGGVVPRNICKNVIELSKGNPAVADLHARR
jgi:hypothetical protein